MNSIGGALALGFLVALISLPVSAVVINFPDPGLEAAVREAISKPSGLILDTDLVGVGLTTLDANSRDIINLEGIQHCTDLTTLNLYINLIADISALSSLTSLTRLGMAFNYVVNINALSGLTNLTYLSLGGNLIVDINALSGLTNLVDLYLYQNLIVDISPLSGLTKLVGPRLEGNEIIDISALAGLTNITNLDLTDNHIVDLAPLVANPGIDSGDTVDVGWNHLCILPGSDDMTDINTLLGRGVSIEYTTQLVCAETSAVFKVDERGNVLSDQAFYGAAFETGAADVAEWVTVSEPAEPGDVVEFDPVAPQQYRIAQGACSLLIAGVISTVPGVVLGSELQASNRALLALIGIVPVKVTNEGGSIHTGDLLVTSSTPGHAMRWGGPDPCTCSLVGKALEPMNEEQGVILVLLTAH